MLDSYPAEKYGAAVDYLESNRGLDQGLHKAAWELMHAGMGRWQNPELRQRHEVLVQALQQRHAKASSADGLESNYAEARRLEKELRAIHRALRAEAKFA
ncbi:MAG TPA: hypothetical protein VM286_08240 [Candidatus Thermoplasmatota archaeon]|nr:hypothetical protein [Candidatus Thermoplasmatota archaeon]